MRCNVGENVRDECVMKFLHGWKKKKKKKKKRWSSAASWLFFSFFLTDSG